jgi:hypothetical protein
MPGIAPGGAGGGGAANNAHGGNGAAGQAQFICTILPPSNPGNDFFMVF